MSGERRARLRLGVAGLGSMGQNHVRLLAARPDVRLAAVADPDERLLGSVGRKVGAQRFASPVAMIAEASLDGLVVAAPTTAHLELALAAIDRGIPVLVEKPLAATAEEAAQIADAGSRLGVPVQVGHVERFNPAVRKLSLLLHEGWLSTVYSISSRRAGPFPARIRDVGVTIDLATHDVDILSWIAGERPTRVFAETARRVHTAHEDLLFGLLYFGSGATGFLDVNWLTPTKRRELLVVGEEGMFELDYLTQRLTFTKQPDVAHPRLLGGYAPTFDVDVVELRVDRGEPLAAELDAFLAVARGEMDPIISAEDGLWAVATAQALLASSLSHEPMRLAADPRQAVTA